jgi:hypothetical protein
MLNTYISGMAETQSFQEQASLYPLLAIAYTVHKLFS